MNWLSYLLGLKTGLIVGFFMGLEQWGGYDG